MKRIIFCILTLPAMLCGCQKNDVSEQLQVSPTLQATIEEVTSTRTIMDADNNIRWSEGDQVIAFMKSSYGHKYQLISAFAGKTYADFSLVSSGNGNLSAGTEWNHNIVYYPYSAAIEAEKLGNNYALNVVLPSEQTYTAESFGNGSMAMVAVSENNNITFKNVFGGMKLQLKGTQKVVSITLEGKNNEKLSGAATVTAYSDGTKPAITMASGASASVTLNCGSGVQLSEGTATEFILALPPVIFNEGFTVTVTDSDKYTYTVDTDKLNEVIRSYLLVMPPVTLGAPEGGNSGITSKDYVDEYGVNHGPGIEIDGIVWAPVNCGYHETYYKYGKLYQWGRKYGQGYDGDLYNASGNYCGTYSDSSVPTIKSGPVSLSTGQSKNNENYFYKATSSPFDWLKSPDDELWNSGTESNPVKTDYDPCPNGWRVPTYAELYELSLYHSPWKAEKGQMGYWLSGSESYSSAVSQVFFPAASYRFSEGIGRYRGYNGHYWSSKSSDKLAYSLYLHPNKMYLDENRRAIGMSVRCVLE